MSTIKKSATILKGNDKSFWDKVNIELLAAMARADNPSAQWFNSNDVFTEGEQLIANREKVQAS